MTIGYVDIADATTFGRLVADIDAAYFARMRSLLGRTAGQTIDSAIDARGNITGPAGRTITTRCVAPVTVAGTSGGCIAVNDRLRAFAGTVAPSGRTITLSEITLPSVRVALRNEMNRTT